MGPQPVPGCHGGVQLEGMEQLHLGAGGEGGVAARVRDGGGADFAGRGVFEHSRDCLLIPALYMLAALDVQPNTSPAKIPSIPLPVKR